MLNEMRCCGVREISGLKISPQETLEEVADDWFVEDEFNGAFVIFTDIVTRGRGEELMKFIRSKRLGAVHSTAARLNPNSSCIIKVYTWTVDIEKFKKLARKSKWLQCSGNCDCPNCEVN